MVKAMYTIKRAAQLVGVSQSTLRAWETRYGVGTAHRTESGYRLYDDEAVESLQAMRALVGEGWAVSAAAAETLRRKAAAPTDPDRRGPVGPVASVAGGALPPGTETRDFVRAAADYDAARISVLLDERFSTASFETVVDGWLLPALRDLGVGWETGHVSVAAEHLAAGAVARRVALSYDAAAAEQGGPRVLVGLAPGVRHDIGLLCFATAARRAGLATTYLGADVPVADWQAAVAARPTSCVVLAVPMTEDAEPTASTVAALREVAPDLMIAVGGSAQDLAPEGCLRLGHRVGPAATLLAHALDRRLTPE